MGRRCAKVKILIELQMRGDLGLGLLDQAVILSADLRGEEDLGAMTDQELMDLLDKATP